MMANKKKWLKSDEKFKKIFFYLYFIEKVINVLFCGFFGYVSLLINGLRDRYGY